MAPDTAEPNQAGWLVRLATAVLCVALAVVACLAAIGNTVGRTSPQSVENIWPHNGLALARSANRELVSGMPRDANALPQEVSERTIELSKKALRLEPLAVTAVRNLGYAAAVRGERDRAESLMLAGNEMSKRDAGTNLWLIDHFGKQQDLERTFKYYDLLLRSNSRASGAILPNMAQALAVPGAVHLFQQLLQREPPWAQDFWRAVIQDGNSPQQAAELRTALYREGIDGAPHIDRFLLTQLVRSGGIAEAQTLYAAASTGGTARANSILSDPTFSREPQLAPFDWNIVQGEEFGSSLSTEDGNLRVNSLPGGEGTFLEQLVTLEPGAYMASIKLADGNSYGNDAVRMRIACAELQGQQTFKLEVALLPNSTRRVEVTGPCRQFWFALSLDATDEPAGLDFRIDEISFTPA